ncbi:hypothetical protein Tco_0496997 [Tanacetum coccineum]
MTSVHASGSGPSLSHSEDKWTSVSTSVQALLFNDKMTSVHISSGLALLTTLQETLQAIKSVAQRKERCTLQAPLLKENTSGNNTIDGVCRQHFRPRCSKKRKVYALVRFIFGRREIFLCLTILINMIHVFSMLVMLSNGSTYLILYCYSLVGALQTLLYQFKKLVCFVTPIKLDRLLSKLGHWLGDL